MGVGPPVAVRTRPKKSLFALQSKYQNRYHVHHVPHVLVLSYYLEMQDVFAYFSFSIFAGTVFKLQGHSIGELVQLGVGGDLWVYSPRSESPLPEQALRDCIYFSNCLLRSPASLMETIPHF